MNWSYLLCSFCCAFRFSAASSLCKDRESGDENAV